jgi:DNA (cytosine-5)-methyltransferase 1
MEPEVFVMENVKGILSSSVQGQKIFPQLLQDLRNPAKAISNKPGASYHIYSLVSEPDDLNMIDGPVYNSVSDFIIRCEKYGIPQMRHRVILLGVGLISGTARIIHQYPIPSLLTR